MSTEMKTAIAVSPLAGKPAPKNAGGPGPARAGVLSSAGPTWAIRNQLVSFGTSGHRGTSLRGTFTEAHILAITQAICDYRRSQGIDGPLYMGKDTHALSGPGPAHRSRGAGGQRRRDHHPARTTA